VPVKTANCSRDDVRLDVNVSQPNCELYQSADKIVPVYLFPPGIVLICLFISS
jgi:hypothetical protein